MQPVPVAPSLFLVSCYLVSGATGLLQCSVVFDWVQSSCGTMRIFKRGGRYQPVIALVQAPFSLFLFFEHTMNGDQGLLVVKGLDLFAELFSKRAEEGLHVRLDLSVEIDNGVVADPQQFGQSG